MFSLWDERSLDPVGMYRTLDDALAVVREGVELNGPGDTISLSLVEDLPGGELRQIANGARLAAMANAAGAVKSKPPARSSVAD
ncbi:MAG TPA: hypothetical protein VFQ54_01360 [Thermomicrobiales bacterium]|nr:hypothetical protein [Thermomicrobiales bacterium]